MRYFVPDIRVPPSAEVRPGFLRSLFGGRGSRTQETAGTERLGGAPWGLPRDRWPKCADCGKSQSLLAQLKHHPDRLDLGREGRVLFVFQCAHDPGMCSTWEAFSGANACIVVEPEELGASATPRPEDAPPSDPEVLIAGWAAREDPVPTEMAEAFLSDVGMGEVPESLLETVTWSTRLGGAPRWLQSADEAPRPGWRFVGQLDGTYSFLSPPPAPTPPWVSPDREAWEGRTHFASGPNFGGGLAYLFVRTDGARPEGCMFWQR